MSLSSPVRPWCFQRKETKGPRSRRQIRRCAARLQDRREKRVATDNEFVRPRAAQARARHEQFYLRVRLCPSRRVKSPVRLDVSEFVHPPLALSRYRPGFAAAFALPLEA